LLFFNCKENAISTIHLDDQLALIPEGIAVDPSTKDIYLSSLLKDIIVRYDSTGSYVSNVIKRNEKDYSTGVGLIIKNNMLWALGSVMNTEQSALFQIDIKTNKIVNRYTINDTLPNYFNDLTIDKQSNIYITDTHFHRVYKFDINTKSIGVFLEHEQIKHPNGITISSDYSKLFVDSFTHGIRIIDIKNKKILNATHEPSSNQGIDGLKYYKNTLYAVINGSRNRGEHRLVKYKLSKDERQIFAEQPLITNHALMDIPTTIDIVDNKLFLLANSQMENYNDSLKSIIDNNRIINTYIIKHKLK